MLRTYSANRAAVAAFNGQSTERKQQARDITAYYGKIKERDVQKIIVDFCEKAQIPYMRNRDVKLVKRKDGSIVPSKLAQSQKGKPDLTVVGLDRITIWIETKAPNGKLSPDQIVWRDALINRGHEYYSPRDAEAAEAVCRRLLVVGR